jgi:hypothetical protein
VYILAETLSTIKLNFDANETRWNETLSLDLNKRCLWCRAALSFSTPVRFSGLEDYHAQRNPSNRAFRIGICVPQDNTFFEVFPSKAGESIKADLVTVLTLLEALRPARKKVFVEVGHREL